MHLDSSDVGAAEVEDSLGVTSLQCFFGLDPMYLVNYAGIKILQALELHPSVCHDFQLISQAPSEKESDFNLLPQPLMPDAVDDDDKIMGEGYIVDSESSDPNVGI